MLKSTRQIMRISHNEINSELKTIFIDEFFESFHDILISSQEEFLSEYIHRLNIILSSYNQSIIPYIRSNPEIFRLNFREIFEDYYLPIKFQSKSALNSSKKEILKNFHPHCESSFQALHTCQGLFILVKDQSTKTYKYAICSNCKYIYCVDCILMYCPECDCDYFSSYNEDTNDSYQPATWDRYHCGIMLNQQMTCLECNDYLWLRGKKLYCKKCKKTWNPLDINWKCIMCGTTFNVDAKIYNPLEFKAMKISVKNAIVKKLVIKPIVLPCKCDNNPMKLDFYHNKKCNGVLYEGDIFRKKIVVCSVCRIFASVNKFKWICPICNESFKTANTRSIPSSEIPKDEFIVEITPKRNEDSFFNHGHKSMNTPTKQFAQFERRRSQVESIKNIPINLKKQISLGQSEGMPMNFRGSTPIIPRNLVNNTPMARYRALHMSIVDFPNPKIMKNRNNESEETADSQIQYRSAQKPSGHMKLNSYAITESSMTAQKRRLNNLFNNDDLSFDINDYTVVTQLGQGTFGKIYLVEDKQKNVFCMKKIIINNKNNFESMKNEYEIFRKYKHKNILNIMGITEKKLDDTTFAFYILMEVGKTDWEKEINQRQSKGNYYTENELMSIIRQLTSALAYLQKNNISHRDVKAQNVLVFDNNIYKIADFGEAKKFNDSSILSTLRGTELYMSPILFDGLQNRTFDIKHNPYKSDVFSLGMCLLFAATLNIKILCKVRDFGDNAKLQIFIMSVINKRYSLALADLLMKMLSISEITRPDFIKLEEILD